MEQDSTKARDGAPSGRSAAPAVAPFEQTPHEIHFGAALSRGAVHYSQGTSDHAGVAVTSQQEATRAQRRTGTASVAPACSAGSALVAPTAFDGGTTSEQAMPRASPLQRTSTGCNESRRRAAAVAQNPAAALAAAMRPFVGSEAMPLLRNAGSSESRPVEMPRTLLSPTQPPPGVPLPSMPTPAMDLALQPLHDVIIIEQVIDAASTSCALALGHSSSYLRLNNAQLCRALLGVLLRRLSLPAVTDQLTPFAPPVLATLASSTAGLTAPPLHVSTWLAVQRSMPMPPCAIVCDAHALFIAVSSSSIATASSAFVLATGSAAPRQADSLLLNARSSRPMPPCAVACAVHTVVYAISASVPPASSPPPPYHSHPRALRFAGGGDTLSQQYL